MSNVVRFLESLARTPKPMSAEDFATAVEAAQLAPSTAEAVLLRDPDALSRAIGGRVKMMCIVVPAENDEPAEQEDGDGEETPDRETESLAA